MHGRALLLSFVLGVALLSAACPDVVSPIRDDAGSDVRSDAGPGAPKDGGGDDAGGPRLVSLSLSPAAPELPIGLSVRMRAVGSYDDGSTAQLASEVSWSSDAPAIADVGSEGADTALVTAYAAGTATIHAALGDVSASVTVTVLPRALVSLEVSPPSAELSAGYTVQLSASASYDDDSTADVTSTVSWSSSAPDVATVSASGLVTTLQEGNALIEARSGDVSASSVIAVAPPEVVQVATFDKHSAALLSNGRVLAFGRNRYGQIGVAPGQTETSCATDGDCAGDEVCDVNAGGRGVCSTFCLADAACAAGDLCACEATDAGGACVEGYCIDIVSTPTLVPGVSGATRVITTAFTTFVLLSDGSALGFGRNTKGLFLGNGDDDGRSIERTPQPLLRRTETGSEPLTGIVDLKGGLDHVLVLVEDGHVYAFGRGWVGQVGDGDTSDENAAVLVTLPPATSGGARIPLVADAIAAGSYHALAIERGTGRVLGWGWNGVGQLGDGTEVGPVSDDPATVALDGQGWAEPICAKGSGAGGCLVGASAVDAGWAHSVALVGGDVIAWGWNHVGQLGDGSEVDRALPGSAVLSDVVAIESGYGHVAALSASGWRVWGENVRGQLGLGTTTESHVPVPLSLPALPVQLTSGGDHNLALLPDGRVYVWGWNRFGELGLGDRSQRNTPVLHPTLPP